MTERGEWLSLKDAADLLGVHPSTVRLWSDKGILPVHRTQGGHRRYKRSEVSLWAETSRKSRVIEPKGIIQNTVKNVRLQIAEGRLEAEPWYQKLDEEARVQYRQSAHSLFQGLMAYLASTGQDASSEAYAIGYEYASRARHYNLKSSDAVRAFLFFRNALIESMIKVYADANAQAGQAIELFHKMQNFTDEILVSLLETYQALENANH
jgi:excisionase family DNA binding protein